MGLHKYLGFGVPEDCGRAGRVLEQSRRDGGGHLALPPRRCRLRHPVASPRRTRTGERGGGAFLGAGRVLLAWPRGGVGDHGQVILLVGEDADVARLLLLLRQAVEPHGVVVGVFVGGAVVVQVGGPAGLAAAAALGTRRRRHPRVPLHPHQHRSIEYRTHTYTGTPLCM
jgi:hypothetical protein